MRGSLQGRKVLVTREKTQARQFSDLVEKSNGVPIEVPLLSVQCRTINNEVKLEQFSWIFFTSAHGVDCFFKQIGHKDHIKHIQFATVGHKTELALKQYGYKAAFIPSTYNAWAMAKEFFEQYPLANNILLVRGNLSRKLLVEEL